MKQVNLSSDRFQSKLEMRALKQATLSVLAVDDEPGILEMLQSALPELENCQVTTATTADDALELIRSAKTPFDCLLLDIQMPEKNGIELLREIRREPGNQDTPVIMLTAMDDRKHIEDAFLEGAFDYITKPFDFFELRSRMNAAHLLMMERIKTQTSTASIRNLREELDHSQQFRFDDPLTLDGLQRCLRCVEFSNYLEQMTRARRSDTWVTAVKLQDAQYRFDLGDYGGFRRAISDIGECIEGVTRDSESIFSYRGSGVFLIVTHGRECTDQIPSEEVLNQKLAMILSNRCASVHLKTVMSTAVSMRSISKAGVSAALNKALDQVSEREDAFRKGTIVPLRPVSKDVSDTKKKGTGRLFETVMQELYGNNSYLARK